MSKIYDALQHLEAQRRSQTTGEATDAGANPLDLQERPPAEQSADRPQQSADRPQQSADRLRVSAPILEQTAAVTRFGAELHRRMGEAGLDGVHGLFALAEQLNRALATVSHSEIEHAEGDLERVADQVRAMQGNLRQLKSVKIDLEGMNGLPKL
jgi:hypothetical protein